MGSVYWEKLVPQITPPKVPSNIEGLGIPVSVVENLVLKHLSAYPKNRFSRIDSTVGSGLHDCRFSASTTEKAQLG